MPKMKQKTCPFWFEAVIFWGGYTLYTYGFLLENSPNKPPNGSSYPQQMGDMRL